MNDFKEYGIEAGNVLNPFATYYLASDVLTAAPKVWQGEEIKNSPEGAYYFKRPTQHEWEEHAYPRRDIVIVISPKEMPRWAIFGPIPQPPGMKKGLK